MRFVIQRVNHAKCTIDGNITGSIEKGLCVLIGIAETDTKEIADKMIKKLINMRIFADENDKTNLSINDVDGKLLLISQFTLYANCKKGNRPSFVEAGSPDMANELYEYCISECDKAVPGVQRGVFGAESLRMTGHLRLYWIRTSCKRYKYERHFYGKIIKKRYYNKQASCSYIFYTDFCCFNGDNKCSSSDE